MRPFSMINIIDQHIYNPLFDPRKPAFGNMNQTPHNLTFSLFQGTAIVFVDGDGGKSITIT